MVHLDDAKTGNQAVSTSCRDVSDDAFLGDALSVLQPKSGYRAGMDAVMLAASLEAGASEAVSVLDIGAGAGVVGLCVAVRLPSSRVVLVEKNRDLVCLAKDNISRNQLSGRIRVINVDVLACREGFGLEPESFDHVLSNPPFYNADSTRVSENQLKADAHTMPTGGLDGWLRFMARMTRPGGQATMIHLAERVDDVLSAFRGRFGGVLVQPLHPRDGAPANRVIVRGTKGSRRPMQLLAGIVLHGHGNAFLPEIDQILRKPGHLRLRGCRGGASRDD